MGVHSGISNQSLEGDFIKLDPIGCAGSWFKMTFPFLSRSLCSTLPDSPPDSGSEAYSPQQVNGKCLKEREGGKV